MRVLVGMSGGLDSTYAALKLQRAGHYVEGAVLVMHEYSEAEAAKESADAVGIKLNVIDCTKAFEAVKENFINEYKNGRTPNPCIICNPTVKFKYLYEYALAHGFDRIATGHYARVVRINGENSARYAVSRAEDEKKDQTYMLYRIPQEILSMLILPLCDDTKEEIREKAQAAGLSAAKKKDSQEICFIPDGDYASYIENRIGAFPEGDFIDPSGAVLGKHRGIIRYTIGQRKGLGISLGDRAFVTEIDPVSNTVTLSKEGIYKSSVTVRDIVYSGISEPSEGSVMRVKVKLRYLAKPEAATVTFNGDRSCTVILDDPARSVTPGQSAVMYDGDTVVFGGFIA